VGDPVGGGLMDTSPAHEVVRVLIDRGQTVAVAESLTGGGVTDALVSVPGASGCLRGGVVAYAADLKVELLDVPAELVAQHGTVHPDVARAMAEGVRRRLRADYGVSTTGVAGPGAQEGHPAGTFHVAVDGPSGCHVVSVHPDAALPTAGRAVTRAAARDAALDLLVRCTTGDLANLP
jgi:nicotinamide-nucleotide amidase